MSTRRIPRAIDLWALARELPDDRVALLDNPVAPGRLGSISYLGLFPIDELRRAHGSDPAEALEALEVFTRSRPSFDTFGPPLRSGVIGYLAYELLRGIEPSVPEARAPDQPGQLLHLVRFGAIVAVDAREGTTYVSAEDPALMQNAIEFVEAAPDRIELSVERRPAGRFGLAELLACDFDPVTDPAEYLANVERAKAEIAAGRHFELCLTQEFRASTQADGREIYDELRRRNPAPMGAYLRDGGLEVICSSPERLVGVSAERAIETRPIKGTRPRSADASEDRHLAEALAASPKDRAENTMIVDLARNDLGRICETGSVSVPELCVVESYASVHHLVSTVRGRLEPGTTPVDVIRACFPGGSMTGAPKVEAMKAIAETERSRRGIFSGAIGWIGDDGAMDLNIVIRTLIKHGNQISLHTGGAVTSDSDPQAEYAETMDKARVLVQALAQANSGASRAADAPLCS